MKARLINTSKFRLVSVCILSVCLAFSFAPNSFARVSRSGVFDYTRMFMQYNWAKYNINTGLYDIVGSDASAYVNPDLNTDTGFYEWSFVLGSQPSTCDNKCYILVRNIQFTPRTYTNPINYPDSEVADYTHLFIFSEYSFISGPLYQTFSNMNSIYMSARAEDAWIPASQSNHGACNDMGSSNCHIDFWADAVPDLQDSSDYNNYYYGFSLNIKNSVFDEYYPGPEISRPYPWIQVVQNPYNEYIHAFDHNNSFLYFIPNNTSPRTIKFYGIVWQDDDLNNGFSTEIDLSDVSPDFDVEYNLINRNANNASGSASGLNVGFSVPWIFQAWFNLFVNNDCTNIPNLQSMIHSSESTVCTPWPSTVRSTLTPIFSVLSSMLAFGFVIRWLSGHSKEGSLG